MVAEGTVVAQDGSVVSLRADSICVHGDTPGAVALAREVREILVRNGVQIQPFIAA